MMVIQVIPVIRLTEIHKMMWLEYFLMVIQVIPVVWVTDLQ